MPKVLLKLLILGCLSILCACCACSSGPDSIPKNDFDGAVPEPFALRVKAEKRLSEDYQREPKVFDINSEGEFNKLIKKYQINYDSREIDYGFSKSFFKKNKIYVVMKDGDSISVKCEMKSFKVEADTLNIVFEYSSRIYAQDFSTLGFIVVTDRERVKDVKNVYVNYETLNQK